MVPAEGPPVPRHGPTSHDCRTWARDHRESGQDTTHSGFLHDTAREMNCQFWAWVEASVGCIRGQTYVGPTRLPNPSDLSDSIDGGFVDATTAVFVVGLGEIRGREAEGAYVGIVVQEPLGDWRGISGFFLSWCPACDPGGNRAIRHLRRVFAEHSVSMTSIWDMPSALHPRHGWFGNDRLLLAGFINPHAGLDSIWRGAMAGEITGPALIATGPTMTGLANVVLVDNLAVDGPRLRQILGNVGYWSVRVGEAEILERLVGIGEYRAPTRLAVNRTGRVPAAWGAYRIGEQPTVFGPTPNLWMALRRAVQTRPGQVAPTVTITYLPAGRAVRLTEILALTPALS